MFIRHTTRQKGISLIEILLVTVIIAAGAVGVFMFSKNAKLTAAVSAEQAQVEQTVKTISGLFSTQPNYGSLSADYLNSRAAGSGLSFRKDTNGEILLDHNLPSRVTARIQPANVQFRPNAAPLVQRPAAQGNAFAISYDHLNTKECINLVTALAPSAVLTRVQPGNGGASRHVSIRGQQVVDKDQIIQGCTTSRNNPNALVVLYFQGNMSASAPPPVSTVLPTCSPTTENQTIACPTGQQGSITQQRSGACTGAGGSLVWSSWATVENTCVDIPTAPADVVPEDIEKDCVDNQFTRVVACPAGEVGQVTQSRTVNSCLGNTSAWVEVSRSCVSAGAPAATCLPTTEQRVQPCPAGQTGSITQVRSSSCSSPTAALDWTPWETISNTCRGTATCMAQRESGPIPCAAGYYGPWEGNRERFRSCINATTQGGWSTWNILVPNTSCQACPGNATETQWVPRSQPCPSGYTGSHTWEAEQRRTKSYACPAGTLALPSPSYTAWVDTGARRAESNTCAAATSCVKPVRTYWSSGSPVEEANASWSIDYTLNGVRYSCSVSAHEISGKSWEDAGSCVGFPRYDVWKNVATLGDTYESSGTSSCCTGAAYDPGAWTGNDTERYEMQNDPSCAQPPPSWKVYDDNYQCAQDSNCSYPGRYGTLDQELKKQGAMCLTATRGTVVGVDWCEQNAVQCSAQLVCD